ncbi:MAG: hypothetical protein QM759_15450 [Terricaulis sp.]
MPSDNVTPFRRPPKRVQQKQQQGFGFKTHRGKAVLVQALTIATYAWAYFFPFPPPPDAALQMWVFSSFTFALALAALSLAMSNRYDAMPWAATHHEHALRTLVFGFIVWSIADALTYISGALMVVAWYVHLAVLAWVAIRTVIGLGLALLRRPIPRPRGVLI